MNKIIFVFFSCCVVACTPSTRYVKSESSARNDFENDNLSLASSGYIGCPASEIIISGVDVRAYDDAKSWKATCRNKSFYCSEIFYYRTAYPEIAVQLSCAEEI
ncbi:hypothetical protein [uncultured Microbulbifer sp.]|uniref:hypothetical protein n=1 Tax=uncultured Microbulbifer sp. TaxID=348147 RepID=UPI0026041148|nr:hypothetical protein [uncultured Microbulbifer sp.]